MSTIVTRATKGSALTWTEGDANITNLNNDKIENVVEDLTPQLGGDLDVNGKQIVSTANGNINIVPNGSGNINLTPATGHVTISATNFPTGTGTSGQVLSTDGTGNASWTTVSGGGGLANIVEDTTPQLGGDLDLNDKNITNSGTLDINVDAGTDNHLNLRSLGTGNVVLTAVGTGQVQITHPLKIGDLVFPSGTGTSGQVLTTNGTNAISWTTPNSTASVASTVTLTADNATAATNYPLFVNAATGNLSPRTDTGFTYNPSTGVLTSSQFSGVASQINVAGAVAANYQLALTPASTIGGVSVTTDTLLTYNGTTDVLSVPSLTASATITAKTISESTIFTATYATPFVPNVANGNIQKVTLTGNLTFNGFTTPVTGQTLTLLVYGGVGYNTVTSTMLFAGGNKTLSGTTGCLDVITVTFTDGVYLASIARGFA